MSDNLTDHNEETLDKVRAGLREAAALAMPVMDDMINGMQSQGILFRERTDAGATSNGTGMTHRHGQHSWHRHDDDGYLNHQRPIDGEQGVMPVVKGHPAQLFDGYHTMEELYDHRRALTAALLAERADISWRSRAHHPDDSPMFEGGYFIVGIDTPHGTITYHYKLSHWDDFAEVPEVEHAPKWDGAAPEDTVTRLLAWARGESVPLQMTAPTRVVTQIGDDPGRTRTDVWS